MKDSLKTNFNRNNNFGTLHLLGACLVLYGHQCVLINTPSPIIMGNNVHTLGVRIIFLISGYMIAKSLLKEKNINKKIIISYIIKRLGRIYPEYFTCLLITSLVIGPLFTTLKITDYFYNANVFMYIKKNLLLAPRFNLPGVFQDNPYVGAVNGSLWTMPVEVFLYLFIIIVAVLYIKLKKKVFKTTILFLFFCTIFLYLAKNIFFLEMNFVVYDTDWISALNLIIYFMTGCMFYLIDKNKIKKYLSIEKALIILLISITINFNTYVICELICLFVLSYVVFSIGLSANQELKLKYFNSRYAYGIYLWGFVLQQCIIDQLYVHNLIISSTNLLFIISFVATYFVAAVSYRFVYLPISKWTFKLVNQL